MEQKLKQALGELMFANTYLALQLEALTKERDELKATLEAKDAE